MTDEFAAIVYDLDGTLVRLDVDWEAVRQEVAGALRARGVDADESSLWSMRETAAAEGHGPRVEAIIAEHERAGARTARRLPLADVVSADRPVAVCSLNAEAACRIALEHHGLDSRVDAIVGRDSLDVAKPDPEPLLVAIQRLGVDPQDAVFVGDSDRDADTAERAGVAFRHVADLTDTSERRSTRRRQ